MARHPVAEQIALPQALQTVRMITDEAGANDLLRSWVPLVLPVVPNLNTYGLKVTAPDLSSPHCCLCCTLCNGLLLNSICSLICRTPAACMMLFPIAMLSDAVSIKSNNRLLFFAISRFWMRNQSSDYLEQTIAVAQPELDSMLSTNMLWWSVYKMKFVV